MIRLPASEHKIGKRASATLGGQDYFSAQLSAIETSISTGTFLR